MEKANFSQLLNDAISQPGIISKAYSTFYGYSLGNDQGIISVTNGLVGCNFEYNKRSTVTFAYVTPLGGGADRFFDGELRAFVNWRFGPQNRLTRAQF